eukprot:3932492-Rhodomonas_salina.1
MEMERGGTTAQSKGQREGGEGKQKEGVHDERGREGGGGERGWERGGEGELREGRWEGLKRDFERKRGFRSRREACAQNCTWEYLSRYPAASDRNSGEGERKVMIGGGARWFAYGLHPEIKHKKPQSQDLLYQKCGFLDSISGCRSEASGRVRELQRG